MDNIKLRLLKDNQDDYQLLHKWYHNPKVYTYFEQRIPTYDEIVTKYSKRTTLSSITPVYIIEYQNIPVGVIQYTKLTSEVKQQYQLTKDGYEIDLFIGEENYYHKGIGSMAIKLLINILNKEDIIFIMIPETSNINAIACYKKVGFTKVATFADSDTLGNPKEKVMMIYE